MTTEYSVHHLQRFVRFSPWYQHTANEKGLKSLATFTDLKVLDIGVKNFSSGVERGLTICNTEIADVFFPYNPNNYKKAKARKFNNSMEVIYY